MTISIISNGEQAGSIRNKLNNVINQINTNTTKINTLETNPNNNYIKIYRDSNGIVQFNDSIYFNKIFDKTVKHGNSYGYPIGATVIDEKGTVDIKRAVYYKIVFKMSRVLVDSGSASGDRINVKYNISNVSEEFDYSPYSADKIINDVLFLYNSSSNNISIPWSILSTISGISSSKQYTYTFNLSMYESILI